MDLTAEPTLEAPWHTPRDILLPWRLDSTPGFRPQAPAVLTLLSHRPPLPLAPTVRARAAGSWIWCCPRQSVGSSRQGLGPCWAHSRCSVRKGIGVGGEEEMGGVGERGVDVRLKNSLSPGEVQGWGSDNLATNSGHATE